MLVLGAALVWLIPPDSKVIPEEVRQLFIWPFGLAPEAKEKKIYITLVLMLLPISFLSFFINSKIAIKLTISEGTKSKVGICSFYFLTIIFPVVTLYSSWLDLSYIFQGTIKEFWAYFLISSLVISMLILWVIRRSPIWLKNADIKIKHINSWIWSASVVFFVILFSYRIKTIDLVEYSWLAWSGINFEIILYSLSQVVSGKTLIVDLPAQYGLYAEVLNPLFQVIGLTVLSFTVVMTGLTIISISLIIWICSIKSIKTNLLKGIGVPIIIASVSAIWTMLPQSPDFYLAYQPIRIIFPSIYIAAIYFYLKDKNNYLTLIIVSLILAFGLIWNLDTGIPLIGSFLCLQGLDFLFSKKGFRRRIFLSIVSVIAIISFVIYIFSIYLKIKSGVDSINWHDVIKYQEIIYVSGFNMLPMPSSLLHPWMLVILVYIFGISQAINQKLQNKSSTFWDFILILSICGIGLFTYYQGRSHFYNLCNALWPAIVIFMLLADHCVRLIKIKLLSTAYLTIVLFPIIFMGIYSINLLFFNVASETIPNFIGNIKYIEKGNETGTAKNIQFIKNNSRSKACIVIYSLHQSIYFAESSKSSCINGPGLYETHLVADEKAFLNNLKELNDIDLYIDETKAVEFIKKIDGDFSISANSQYGLLLFRKAK